MLSLFFGVIISFSIHAKEVALTFDDAPMGDMSVYSGNERTKVLIEVLERYKIKTVFFSISSNLKKSNGLDKYQAAGHLIANHTNTHPNFDETSIEKYIEDFNTADEILRQFKNFRPWFRFPILKLLAGKWG
jgi:peptidoglycan/xylan/chitin deacetylase (PgdA/CDA1 family)